MVKNYASFQRNAVERSNEKTSDERIKRDRLDKSEKEEK
jgi:hypothetical protein